MREMEARAFMNEHYNSMSSNNHRGGYSNSDTKSDVENMIPNAKWNIDNMGNRLEESNNTDSREIDVRTSRDLEKMKKYVNDMDKNENK